MLLCLRKLTHWDSRFPIDFKSVLHYLRDLYNLGLHLNIRLGVLDSLEADYPTNTERTGEEVDELLMLVAPGEGTEVSGKVRRKLKSNIVSFQY